MKQEIKEILRKYYIDEPEAFFDESKSLSNKLLNLFLNKIKSQKKEIAEIDKWGDYERGVLQGYNKALEDLLTII